MTPRRMPPVLVTGCVLALVCGGCLAQAVERERGQEDRLGSKANEPLQHKEGLPTPRETASTYHDNTPGPTHRLSLTEWMKKVARRSLQAMEPHLSTYGPELAPESASEGVFFAQMRSFVDIQTAAPDQAPAAPAPITSAQPTSYSARAPVPATAVSPAEAEAAPVADAAASQGAAEAAGGARNESAGSSPCDALEGGPAEWMKTGGAMGLTCAQQRAMGVEASQGASWDPHSGFKMAGTRQGPPSLTTLLRQRMALQQQIAADGLKESSEVRSFMSAATNVNPRDPAGTIRAITASAVGAVAQATNDADGYVLYVPSGPDGQLVGSDFTSFFLAAATNPQVNGMRLQKGKYKVTPGANPGSHMWLLCNPGIPRTTPFVVDLGGSELIFQDRMKSMFFITNCVNTEIRGPVRAYHNPADLPFTQGTIKEINNAKASGYNWVIQIHDGFPADTAIGPDGKGKGFLMRFNPKTLLMPDDYFDAGFLSHTKLSTSPPTYRYTFDAPQPAGKVGDYVALRGTGAHAIMMNQCANVTLNGLTMHNVGMFWIIDWQGSGNTYMNNTLTPWPEPIGSNKMPVLLSGNADGIHSLGASFGPKVIGNTISNNGDDAVAIHGLYFLVTKVQPETKTVVIATPDLRGSIQIGNTVVAYATDQLATLGNAMVKGMKQVGNPLLPGTKSKMLPDTDFTHQQYYELTLDAWPEGFAGLAFDTLISSSEHTGSGFELRDNVIMNNRGRGMLIKAGNGVMEGNTIIRPTFWPVQVMPEWFWAEADWSHDIRIANNYIEGPYGGILVGLIRLYEQGSGQFLNHRNITILNNTLANVNYAPIIVTSAVSVTIGNNTIQDAMCQNPSIGQGYKWLDGSSLIYAENVMGLVFDPPNRVTNQAGCTHGDYARPITLGKNVANVKFGGGLVSVS